LPFDDPPCRKHRIAGEGEHVVTDRCTTDIATEGLADPDQALDFTEARTAKPSAIGPTW
jgi:hypothetical protein